MVAEGVETGRTVRFFEARLRRARALAQPGPASREVSQLLVSLSPVTRRLRCMTVVQQDSRPGITENSPTDGIRRQPVLVRPEPR